MNEINKEKIIISTRNLIPYGRNFGKEDLCSWQEKKEIVAKGKEEIRKRKKIEKE